MTIKTVCSYSCSVCCTLIVIFAVATNYWIEYVAKEAGAQDSSLFNIGLFEKCETYRYDMEGEEDRGCNDYSPDVDGFMTARYVLVGTYIIALLLTLIAFIFVTVYCATGKYYFPIGRVAVCFMASAVCIIAGLISYTMVFKAEQNATFSWSYGAGWSAAGMYIITTVLLYADK